MKKIISVLLATIILNGCSVESSRSIEAPKVKSYNSQYNGIKTKIAIGKFNDNKYQNGIFSDSTNRLGDRSKTLLISHLQQTNHFNMLDRSNIQEIEIEAGYGKKVPKIKGADYIISGDITGFGRKETGDQQLWGILGKGKAQIAYAKVTLNVINTETSEVIYSVQGAGEYKLSDRELIGFVSKSSYDPSLTDKVLDLAIREAVDNLVQGLEHGYWKP